MVFKSIFFGLAVGIFIIQPIVISLYAYDAQGDVGNWWNYLSDAYRQVVSLRDLDQALSNFLFAVTGVSIVIVVQTWKKIFYRGTKNDRIKELEVLLKKGESQRVEFKSSLRWDLKQHKMNKSLEDSVAKSVAGFMNTGGGNLFIGIDDNGNIIGLEEDYRTLKKPGRDGFEQYVMQLISTKLGTQYCRLIESSFYQFNNRDVIRLSVKTSDVPVYLHMSDRSHFFIRTGNGTRELDIQEALEYIETHIKP